MSNSEEVSKNGRIEEGRDRGREDRRERARGIYAQGTMWVCLGWPQILPVGWDGTSVALCKAIQHNDNNFSSW